jgi:hypothetical protein
MPCFCPVYETSPCGYPPVLALLRHIAGMYLLQCAVHYVVICPLCVAGPDHMCDMDRLSVLLHIPRIIDLCGDVPIELVMYVLSGTDGSPDSRGTQEDTLWKVRDQQYDTISADAVREKARVAGIALRLHPADIPLKVLCIVANGNEALYEDLPCQLAAARAQKEQKCQHALEGMPAANTYEHEGAEVEMQHDDENAATSDDDCIEDEFGVIA